MANTCYTYEGDATSGYTLQAEIEKESDPFAGIIDAFTLMYLELTTRDIEYLCAKLDGRQRL